MAYIARIIVESNDEEADEMFVKFVEALQTLLTWQWDNVAISSYKDIGVEHEVIPLPRKAD